MSNLKISNSVSLDEQVEKKFLLLDDLEEWKNFSFQAKDNPDKWDSNIVVEGMHCATCAFKIEDSLKKIPGILDVTVSSTTYRAKITWLSSKIKPSEWMKVIKQLDYIPLPAGDALLREVRRQQLKKMMWRWLVATFCMMQVMMYAYPVYTSAPGEMTSEMEHLMRWASWVLSLPVVLFSCKPFFTNAWNDLKLKKINMDLPVALGIAITFVISSLGTFDPEGVFGHEVYFDSLTMFVFFLLSGRWLELKLRDKTAGALEKLLNSLPELVLRKNELGNFDLIAIRNLVIGDIVQVLPGQIFPVDGVIVDGETASDEAIISGESTPLARKKGDLVLAGSANVLAPVVIEVVKTGTDTQFSQIVDLMEKASQQKPLLAQKVDKIAPYFLIAVLFAAFVAAAYWWPIDSAHALMVAAAVLIVTCPCALSLATPATMLAAAANMAKKGVLVKNLVSLETLAQIDHVVFDKTGTLTSNQLTLDRWEVRLGEDKNKILAIAKAMTRQSLHPLSKAISQISSNEYEKNMELTEVKELIGQGLLAKMNGKVVKLGSTKFCQIEEVSAVQGPHVVMVDENGWLATFFFFETLRDDALSCISWLKKEGISLSLLSGDSLNAVSNIANQLGIKQFFANCRPSQKLHQLRQLQVQGKKLVMVGDGLNDGPVLAAADASFSLGQRAPLAQAQADFVILGDRLSKLPEAIFIARKALKIVKQNLFWAALYNAICVPLAIMGYLPAWLAGLGMAVSSILVLLNSLRVVSSTLKDMT